MPGPVVAHAKVASSLAAEERRRLQPCTDMPLSSSMSVATATLPSPTHNTSLVADALLLQMLRYTPDC